MPGKYKRWSAYVNLVCDQFSFSIDFWADRGYPPSGPCGNLFCPTLDIVSICLTPNNIRRNNDRPLPAKSGIRKPAFGRQKDKNQDQQTKDIPLPRSAWICPKNNLPGCVRQEAHTRWLLFLPGIYPTAGGLSRKQFRFRSIFIGFP